MVRYLQHVVLQRHYRGAVFYKGNRTVTVHTPTKY